MISQVLIGIDSAASEFYIPETDHYNLGFKLKKEEFQTSEKSLLMTGDELLKFYEDLSRKYPLLLLKTRFQKMIGPILLNFKLLAEIIIVFKSLVMICYVRMLNG
jgi:enolase